MGHIELTILQLKVKMILFSLNHCLTSVSESGDQQNIYSKAKFYVDQSLRKTILSQAYVPVSGIGFSLGKAAYSPSTLLSQTVRADALFIIAAC